MTATADQIAGDLALAIHQGQIQPGEQLPTQAKLMKSYGVAMGTASAAFAKLAAVGLVRTVPGRGVFAEDARKIFDRHPVLDVLEAADLCRTLAAYTFGKRTTRPTLEVGGDRRWGGPDEDPGKMIPPKEVDMSALVALDRHVLRWMSEAFLSGARRMVSTGQQDADRHLIEAARAIRRNGARRPEGQPTIALFGGTSPEGEDVARRIWPERQIPGDPDGPPF